MLNQRSDKIELLRIADAVATEKCIDKEIILSSMESAIQKAAKTKFGSENDIRAKIDRESGDISIHKVLKIVETPENFDTEISLKHAIEKEKKEDIKIGDEIFEQLPPVDFGRIAAQTARQVITQSVRSAEKERQYNDFIGKKGDGDQDAGAKIHHLASNTTSRILSKSISKNGGRGSFRGLVKAPPKAENRKLNVVCDALILDEGSRSDTYPTMEVANPTARCEHEASVSKVSDNQLFYLMSRGHTEEEALAMIVNGFFEPFTRELPMEYAVELNQLMALEMEGSIG